MIWIDSHAHHYLSSKTTLAGLKEKGLSGIVNASWIPVRPTSHETLRDLFEWVAEIETTRLASLQLMNYPAIGIHPRCIPPAGLSEAIFHVEELLAQPAIKALGEVGLETGEEMEVDVLRGQLKLAKRLDKPVIIHTPRKNKRAATIKLIALLDEVGIDRGLTVLDHTTFENFDVVKGSGRWIGLTIQPSKLTADEAERISLELDGSNIMANTDTSTEYIWPLGVYDLVEKLEGLGRSDIAEAVAYKNARKFYRI